MDLLVNAVRNQRIRLFIIKTSYGEEIWFVTDSYLGYY